MAGDCECCGKPVPNYEPEMCCNHFDCECQGQPVNPCICGEQCWDAMMSGSGTSEERRIAAGIERWKLEPEQQP